MTPLRLPRITRLEAEPFFFPAEAHDNIAETRSRSQKMRVFGCLNGEAIGRTMWITLVYHSGAPKPMILLPFLANQPLRGGVVPRGGLSAQSNNVSKISNL